MRKNCTSKNARLLSELEEIPCMSNKKNATENNSNLSNNTICLNTEIQTFMNDTYNELGFYLQDNKITNDTEKCQKVTTYINWRGMDYVNLLLSENGNYNISYLVENWNKKQKSFDKSIVEKINSTCNTTTFDYCAILNKNNNCTSPYKDTDLPVTTLLTYEQLNEDSYSTNKIQIIEQRRLKFDNVTYDISNYYFNAYDKDSSELNCAKWSMYIYKRGKLFINMINNEIYSEEVYRNYSINIWNTFSRDMQSYTLEQTGNECNMTVFLHKIKERENSINPYDLGWVHSNNNNIISNQTSGVATALLDNLHSTNGIPNVTYNVASTNSIDNNTGIFRIINNNTTKNANIITTLGTVTTGDQTTLETMTTTSSEVKTQSNILNPDSATQHDLHTTISSPSDTPISSTGSFGSENTQSSANRTNPTVSTEPTTDSTAFFATEHGPSPTTNIIESNENSTTLHSVNKSLSNTDSYTSSPTIIDSSSTNDSTSPNNTIVHNTTTIKPFTTNDTSHTTIPSPSPHPAPLIASTSSIDTKSSISSSSETPTIKPISITGTAVSLSNNTSSSNITTNPTAMKQLFTNDTTSSTSNITSPMTVPSPSSETTSLLSTTSTTVINSSFSNASAQSVTEPSITSITPTNNSTSSNNATSYSTTIIEPFKNSTTTPITNITSPIIVPSPSSEISSSPNITSSTTTNSFFPSSLETPTPSTHITKISSSANNFISSSMSNNISTKISSTSLESSNFNTINNVTKSPTGNNNTSLLVTRNPIAQYSQNTPAPMIQNKETLPLNINHNSTLRNNVYTNPTNMTISNNFTSQTPFTNNTEVTPTVNPTGNVLITIVPAGIFILGIIFFLILLCKYTFIGSWFRNRKSKKKKVRKKMKKISKEPLLMSLNDIDSETINCGKYSLLHNEKQIPLCEISFESERNLKHRQMNKSRECKEIYMESGDKRVYEVVEDVSKHKNESSIEEKKLKKDDTKNEIEEDELNKNRSRGKIRKEKLIKTGLKKNEISVVGYIRKNTLKEEGTSEINVKTKKSTYEKEIKNSDNQMSIMGEVRDCNTLADTHVIALLECKKEEWELIKNEFLKICIEVFEIDEKTIYLKEYGINLLKKGEEENSTVVTEKNSSIPEKWKKEEWFINLKEEWKKEEEKHLEYLKEQEIEKITVEGIRNIVLDKKKEAWKKWIEKQRERSNEYKKQDWFKKILDEYEKEGIHKNIMEEKIEKISVEKQEKEKNNEIDKYEMKKNLTKKMLIDIYMMILEECKKEELEREKDELFKTNTEELGIEGNLEELVNILKKIEEERIWNSILEKKKEYIEKWKREKWFVELMLEWKDNEQKCIEELKNKKLEKKNKERITNISLEKQKIILKKHWEDIRRKWIENDNKEEWFTKLVDETESKEKEYEDEISKKNIQKIRENEQNRESGESITVINRKVKEKAKKYEKAHLEDTDKKINSIINKKKIKWKTIVEIHMIVLEECKKEEWLLNRGKFLETCLEEFKKEEKEKYPKIIENDLVIMSKEEDDISTIMIERQKLLWEKWVERNKSMLKKWKREEWFINLKEKWENEQKSYRETIKESEITDINAGENLMLEKQKKIWREWLKKQRMWFIEHSEEKWFNDLLIEYEKEGCKEEITKRNMRNVKEIHENMELEQDGNNEMRKSKKKKKLIQKVLIEIHMMVLEECKKEELEREKEGFFNIIMKELKIQENLDEVNILKKIEEERSWNSILEKKKEDIEKWKREKWFVELMLEWKDNEHKYIEELNNKKLEKKNKERITNISSEKQKIILKKHWEDIRKKWIANDNKVEWFTKLADEVESKENEYTSEIIKKSIEKKEENGERFEPIVEINRKWNEKVKKYEKTHLEDTDEKLNSIINKKKIKWKTIVEIHMIVLEECKKEEWLLNRGKFLETCLEEFKKEEKGKYPKIIENDLALMGEEENISTIMLEKQKLLWKKWIERNKSMLKKWKKEEWFINLKKKWENEQKSYRETIKGSELIDINTGENLMLEKQKKIWREWLKKQRMWFIEHSEEKWFNDLLTEYEKEECKEGITKRNTRKAKDIHENMKELEQDGNNKMRKSNKKKKLIQKMLIEIHMMVLDECKKVEWEREKDEFFKTIKKELRIQEIFDKEANIF
ncbi:surface-associated interspersed protein (SURFIN) [Plasmodium gallinaceum]|uniref:Surface-associated interspersed protein (SURFIN) n=1 Tax=Plasmodium gallinaceum TaxID=5849 RepID=A0A1J1GU82_PLAGA|nr:surface-associated interspersed protein (SURFIN) [Plasmodium gallinaceum]CRG96071.1 surface-associated interspersed protein (SURFIN) [Plasmodium gallinaceum]